MTTIGDHLRHARTAQDLTQQTVATRLHVSRQTISSWETGHSYPDITSLIALSDLYQLSLDDLLKGDTQMQAVFKQRDTVLHRVRHVSWLLFGIDAVMVLGCVGYLLGWHGFDMTDVWAILVFIVMILTSVMSVLLSRLQAHLRRLKMPRWVKAMFVIAGLAGAAFGALRIWAHWPWETIVGFSVLVGVLAYVYIRYRATHLQNAGRKSRR